MCLKVRFLPAPPPEQQARPAKEEHEKIPTLFARDPATSRKYVLNEVTPGCEWVLTDEGVPTRKYDGSCVLVRDGKLYKRREVKPGKTPPPDFEQVNLDE